MRSNLVIVPFDRDADKFGAAVSTAVSAATVIRGVLEREEIPA
jgi:hypothetical protein